MIKNGEYYLITTDNWFIAPDGQQYKSAWGECELITTEQAFGFKPSRPSTNWFCKVGKGENSLVIAGCQIHYAVKCTNRPPADDRVYTDKNTGLTEKMSRIWYSGPPIVELKKETIHE